jgi:CubicO group peptidase (beta-lactamase class C family)
MVAALTLRRATPESMGVRSESVLDFIDSIESAELELHSLMLLRGGKVLAEGWWKPYRRDDLHLLYSLSKSFASSAVGFAVSEGLLGLDDTVVSFFPNDVPKDASANLLAMRVRHLLSMSTGQDSDEKNLGDSNWVRGFLARPVPYEPGTHFLYNSSATFMLSAIVQRLTGKRLLDYLRPRLLDPLGIDRATWAQNPDGIDFGGWGMSVATESIAKFGQLYLQDGMWEGRRVLPEGWVAEASKSHVSNGDDPASDWAQGYGFQFWRCRHDAYRGDGAYGQYCIVAPVKDMVIAITSSLDDMQAVLNRVWEHLLLPAGDPISENPVAQRALSDRLGSLDILHHSPSALPEWAGSSRFTDGNQTWSFSSGAGELSLRIEDQGGTHTINAGVGSWIYGSCDLLDEAPKPVAAQARRLDGAGLRIEVRYIEEPTALWVLCDLSCGRLRVSTHRRGRFMEPVGPSFEGAPV